VETLLNVLHAGDPFTARHSRRVAALAEALGRAHGLAADALSEIRLAGLLHDMGKLDEHLLPIVHSPDRLSGDQREKIEEHPDEGAHILAPLEAIHPGLIDIVSSHHEAWNGGGYPRGLSGEEIPLGARIISLADVFDAVTQPRVYREADGIEDALRLIRDGRGSRFDPTLLDTLERPEVAARWIEIAEAGRREEAERQDVAEEVLA
jgi:putative two-component system response regulator